MRQHGVVARRQLLAAGVSSKAVRVRVERGRLLVLFHGVYAVGHTCLRREGRWLAAVLAGGPGAALSHRDAAALHALGQGSHARTDVTVRAERANQPGVRFHRTTVLDARDVTAVSGIPVTSVARTLVDLAGVVPRERLSNALRQADDLRVLDVRAVRATLARTAGRCGPGRRAMEEALAELDALATTLTRSSLEVGFQRLMTQARLPLPQTNVRIGSVEVDACWPQARLIVELDGWAFHRGKRAFQRDRERDAGLAAKGWTVVRFTHSDVAGRPAWVADTVRELLVRSR